MPRRIPALASQVSDYEITSTVLDDGVVPCLRARSPQRLGDEQAPVTMWILGPLARTPWAAARARLEPIGGVRGPNLPQWLEAGVGEWAQRSVVWVSATTPVTGVLATAPQLDVPDRLRAIAAAARGAHALHQAGQLHGAICPQAVALVSGPVTPEQPGRAVLAPPALADGVRPLVQIGYPPLGYVDPQLLRGQGGRWSDIWALGATIRHALTGSSPFPGIEELPVVRALAQLLAAPSPSPVELPPGVSGLVDSCLSTDPEARPATADEVAQRLDEAATKW
jgi:serine/threonine-protein kinase